jgi:hypothetical protein
LTHYLVLSLFYTPRATQHLAILPIYLGTQVTLNLRSCFPRFHLRPKRSQNWLLSAAKTGSLFCWLGLVGRL